jgi:3-deoxy-manno-octulosonate cytidylyltransferase (CMP-KDO synthetase)
MRLRRRQAGGAAGGTVPDTDVIAVIPVRWGSTRFPGKPLAPLAGRPVVEHVWRRAGSAATVGRVLVATDDTRIRDAVRAFGGEVVMTSREHASGSDRIAEVIRTLPCRVVVNVQGDEPLLEPAAIDAAVGPLLADASLEATTVAAPLDPAADVTNPHLVKVVVAASGDALYFSRAAIPFRRNPEPALATLHHIGLYAFRREFLLEYNSWPQGTLEQVEGLEQLRLLERGRRLRVVQVPRAWPGVDTPEDLERISALMSAGSA